jgi:hypothetical protein
LNLCLRSLFFSCLGILLACGCVRGESPSAPLPERSPLEVLPDEISAVAWGPAEVVVWSHEFRFVPAVVSTMERVVRELNSLGVPRQQLEHITVGLNLKASPVEWIFLLDGQWNARGVVRGKLGIHGESSRVDVSGELAVQMREGVLFSVAGPRRIAVGSTSLVRSCVSTMQAGSGTLRTRVEAMEETLPDAPLHLVILERYHHVPGLEKGAFVARRSPEPWLEGRVDCVGIAGCERFQESLYRFVQASRAAVSPPSPEALRFYTGLRFAPDGDSGKLVLDPVQL